MSKVCAKKQRTCIGCRRVAAQDELVRIARKDGVLALDRHRKLQGRGAYVCGPACLDRAIGSKGLERAFKMAIPAHQKEKVAAELAALPLKTV